MVTGFCYPCDTLKDAASVAHTMQGAKQVFKVGKSCGIWYCLVTL